MRELRAHLGSAWAAGLDTRHPRTFTNQELVLPPPSEAAWKGEPAPCEPPCARGRCRRMDGEGGGRASGSGRGHT